MSDNLIAQDMSEEDAVSVVMQGRPKKFRIAVEGLIHCKMQLGKTAFETLTEVLDFLVGNSEESPHD